MVLGDDLGLEEAVNLALNTLVGRFSYHSRCSTPLHTWVKMNWTTILGYALELFFLPRGWFGFKFKSTNDVVKILDRLWSYDGGSLMLKRWRISFDPTQGYFQFKHLWVLLSGLPLNLWNTKALMAIGNALGRFICVDEQSPCAPNRKLGRILVEIDIHSGLLETLDIQWRDQFFSQRLDYLGLPFGVLIVVKPDTHDSGRCQDVIHLDLFHLLEKYHVLNPQTL
jgi:hypothetical protein